MTKHNGVFIKIHYKMDGFMKDKSKSSFRNCRNSDNNKFVICGGVYNRDGGTMILHASDLEEAKNIANNNPFAKLESYSFEILNNKSINLAIC